MKKSSKLAVIHREAEERIRRLVAQSVGQRLPSERDLSLELNISRPRLRTILATLRSEGLVEQRLGSGTYALAPDKDRLQRVAVLIDEKLKLGDDPFMSYLFECLQDNLQAEGARCTIERVSPDSNSYHLEDGAITLGLVGRNVIDRQSAGDPPVVGLLLGADTHPSRRASIFTLEDRQAGETAARFLLNKGCGELYFIGRRDIPASRERLRGAEEVLEGTGVTVKLIESRLNYTAGLALGMEWTPSTIDAPIGVIATNDWLAVGFRTGLRRHDLHLAHPIHIVSFDGLPIASDPVMDLHSLAVPIQAIAKDAVNELRNLSRSPVSVGRLVSYPLSWARDAEIDYDSILKQSAQ